MIKVKPITIYNSYLTKGKVYDVIKYIKASNNVFLDRVIIINDKGVTEKYYLYSVFQTPVLIDVTTEYRNKVIDNILS